MSAGIKDRAMFSQEKNRHLNVTIYEPLSQYKLEEKLEMEEQKKNENKIQNKDQKPDQAEEKASQKPGSDMNAAAQPKKKKPVFDDVAAASQYTEIYRILLKNKQEKLKENDNKDKNAEDQKKCIQIFAQEGSGFNQRSNQESSYPRTEVFNEVGLA